MLSLREPLKKVGLVLYRVIVPALDDQALHPSGFMQLSDRPRPTLVPDPEPVRHPRHAIRRTIGALTWLRGLRTKSPVALLLMLGGIGVAAGWFPFDEDFEAPRTTASQTAPLNASSGDATAVRFERWVNPIVNGLVEPPTRDVTPRETGLRAETPQRTLRVEKETESLAAAADSGQAIPVARPTKRRKSVERWIARVGATRTFTSRQTRRQGCKEVVNPAVGIE